MRRSLGLVNKRCHSGKRNALVRNPGAASTPVSTSARCNLRDRRLWVPDSCFRLRCASARQAAASGMTVPGAAKSGANPPRCPAPAKLGKVDRGEAARRKGLPAEGRRIVPREESPCCNFRLLRRRPLPSRTLRVRSTSPTTWWRTCCVKLAPVEPRGRGSPPQTPHPT